MMQKKTAKTAEPTRQTITIRLKPYLQEFLVCKLADDSAEASRKTLIGAILEALVEYCPKGYVFSRQTGPEYISFELPNHLGNKRAISMGVYISEANQQVFERILRRYFDDLFFQYVDDKIRYNKEIKNCILMFCSDYNISFNNLHYEMLKKKYYRRKKKQEIRKKSLPKQSLRSPLIFAT